MNFGSKLYIHADIPWGDIARVTGFTNVKAHPDVQMLSPLAEKVSISIDQVHSTIANLSYKPIKEKYKILIISPADALTLPAQQALLKTIEEPPNDTQIILVTQYPQKLLPTILSRCTVQDRDVSANGSQAEREEMQTLYTTLASTTTSIADRIKLAETYGKTKEVALRTLEDLLLFMNASLKTKPLQTHTLVCMKHIITSIKLLNANVNAKLVVEDTFFAFLP